MITRLDFIGIPSQDADRARSFYRDTLGVRPDEHGQYEQWAGDTCFGIWEPKKIGMPFVAQNGNPWALGFRPEREAKLPHGSLELGGIYLHVWRSGTPRRPDARGGRE